MKKSVHDSPVSPSNHSPPAPWVSRRARWAPALLVLIGLLTHVVALGRPAQVAFDEVHWGQSVTAYCCTGERVFDVHPPHGKLLLTLGAVAAGYEGDLPFTQIGQTYGRYSAAWFRSVPALCGILIPVLLFWLLRGVGASVPTAWLGGFLLALDNAFVLETRTMLFDGVLVAASLGALVCVLAMDRAASSGRALAWASAAGALAGLAIGTKFTGLAVPLLVAAYLWWPGSPRRVPAQLWRLIGVMAASAVIVYLGGWAIHFSLLTNPGPADAFHATTGRFLEDLWVIHRTMFAANAGLSQPHPDASLPLTWPLMKVAPFFWANSEGAALYLVGNPLVWWGGSLLLVVILGVTALTRVSRLRIEGRPTLPLKWWLLLAYAVTYLPLFGVSRILFLYHYLTPLVFALAFVVAWLESAGWIRAADGLRQRTSYFVVMGAAVIGFAAMAPVTYGWQIDGYTPWLLEVIRFWR